MFLYFYLNISDHATSGDTNLLHVQSIAQRFVGSDESSEQGNYNI